MKTRFHLLCCASLMLATALSCQPVRMACVGDSITYGHGIADREHDTYPAILDSLLGRRYDVRNFGLSGKTLMNSADEPYMAEQIYQEALAFLPQIVTIKLGTNDSKPRNWVHQEDFKTDLKLLISSFRELPSKPEIWLCLPAPAMGHAWTIDNEVIANEVIPYIKEVAEEEGIRIIDTNTPLQSHREYFPDTIHPNEEGQMVIAKIIYDAVTGRKKQSR